MYAQYFYSGFNPILLYPILSYFFNILLYCFIDTDFEKFVHTGSLCGYESRLTLIHEANIAIFTSTNGPEKHGSFFQHALRGILIYARRGKARRCRATDASARECNRVEIVQARRGGATRHR